MAISPLEPLFLMLRDRKEHSQVTRASLTVTLC